jgi:hypothetical protein
MKYLFVM